MHRVLLLLCVPLVFGLHVRHGAGRTEDRPLLATGYHVEHVHGCLRIGLVYVAAGVFGNLASAICTPSTASVGASSSVLGSSGAAVGGVLMSRALHGTPVKLLCRVWLAAAIRLWSCAAAAIQLASGAAPSFEHVASLPGWLVGLVMAATLLSSFMLAGSKRSVAADSDAAMADMPADVSAAPAQDGTSIEGRVIGAEGAKKGELRRNIRRRSSLASSPPTGWWMSCSTWMKFFGGRAKDDLRAESTRPEASAPPAPWLVPSRWVVSRPLQCSSARQRWRGH